MEILQKTTFVTLFHRKQDFIYNAQGVLGIYDELKGLFTKKGKMSKF